LKQLFGAIDLGASSGRVIAGVIGTDASGAASFEMHEVHRFANEPVMLTDGFYWDYQALQREIAYGLNSLGVWAAERGMTVASIGVDTWAVDYGLLDADGKLLAQPRHYRDERNHLGVALVDREIDAAEQYARNGLQFLPFNTLYQLAANTMQQPEDFTAARAMLLMPDLIAHWLTGVAVTERTNASTTGLLNAKTHEWDWDLIDKLGFPRRIFTRLVSAGEVVGPLLESQVSHPALAGAVVTAVGTHDTASAVAGAPITKGAAYLSSGTWSLLGLELDAPVLTPQAKQQNFTNELGVENKIRFLKNLSGLWLLQQSLADFKAAHEEHDLLTLLAAAAKIESPARVDVNDAEFVAPGDMPGKIRTHLKRHGFEPPTTPAGIVRVIMDSLADAYADAVHGFEQVTGSKIERLNVVGGGSQNSLLCQLTAKTTGIPVVAGPVEATALGNLMCQAGAHGAGPTKLTEQRAFISQIFKPITYQPSQTPAEK
jgi:rhamnulokinase